MKTSSGILPHPRRSGPSWAWLTTLLTSVASIVLLALFAAVVSRAPKATAEDRLAPLVPVVTAACGTCHAGPEPAGGLSIEGFFPSVDSAA